jgi:uncharacterized protein YhaN
MSIVYTRLAAASFCLVAALALASGCSSTGPERAVQATDSIDALVAEMAKVKGGVDQSLSALDNMVNKPSANLKGQFDAYSQSVAALDGHAKAVGDRVAAMKGRGDDYFKAWEETSASLSSEEMRQYSEERRGKLSAAYADIQEKTGKTKDDFGPFIASLKDIQTYLGLDLTANGLQGVGTLVEKAQAAGTKVKENIDAVTKDCETVKGLLSQKVGAAPAPK